MSEINLKEKYPLSLRWVFYKIIPWIACLIGVLFLFYKIETGVMDINLESIYVKIFYTGLAIIILRLSYLFLYFLTISYSLIGDELYIKRGIIFKKPLGIPISKINAIHLHRSIPEILFGLCTLVIVVPGEIPVNLLSISGFSRQNGESIKAFIFAKN